MLQRMSGQANPKYWRCWRCVQPPLGYQREELKQYDWHSPLNQLVDAVPPESETAREFSELVACDCRGQCFAGAVAAGERLADAVARQRCET